VAAGWPGAALGLLAGYWADRRRAAAAPDAADAAGRSAEAAGTGAAGAGAAGPAPTAASREDTLAERFFRAAFITLGQLCKADGQVTRAEIQAVERVMQRMSLGTERRAEAMRCFREGKAAGVKLTHGLSGLGERLSGHPELSLLFLEVMLSVSWAEGPPRPGQRRLLEAIAEALHVAPLEFARAEAQVAASRHDDAAARAPAAQPALIAEAYRVLGIPPLASDGDLRRAYRRLLGRHHPDKLLAQGLPGEWVGVANEHTHQIRRAWEVVSRARGLR
jgi:DnaJ like chaperone protein